MVLTAVVTAKDNDAQTASLHVTSKGLTHDNLDNLDNHKDRSHSPSLQQPGAA